MNKRKFTRVIFDNQRFFAGDYTFSQIEQIFYNAELPKEIQEWNKILTWAKTAKNHSRIITTNGVFICLEENE